MPRPSKLSDQEISKSLQSHPNWSLNDSGEITRTFIFTGNGDFLTAIEFVREIANVAESMQHHPDIDIRYSKVKCSLSTHDAGGLTELDFELAKQIDDAYTALTKSCA
jgi:4a-hydroxytetrahydrobiopterin dehydratase